MRLAPILIAAALLLPLGQAQAADAAAGEAKFKQLCGTCHGNTGKGDGPAAAGLPVKPRDFSDAEWQKSVDDDYLQTIILKGGPAVGKSPMMTPFAHSLNEAQVKDVIAYIRSLD